MQCIPFCQEVYIRRNRYIVLEAIQHSTEQLTQVLVAMFRQMHEIPSLGQTVLCPINPSGITVSASSSTPRQFTANPLNYCITFPANTYPSKRKHKTNHRVFRYTNGITFFTYSAICLAPESSSPLWLSGLTLKERIMFSTSISREIEFNIIISHKYVQNRIQEFNISRDKSQESSKAFRACDSKQSLNHLLYNIPLLV